MLDMVFTRTTEFCLRYAAAVILGALLVTAGAAYYVARHFAVNTNISNLLSPDMPWRQHQVAYDRAFPQQATSILAVVNAPTPEFAGAAANALSARLAPQKAQFRLVDAVGSGEFFARNALLYLSPQELAARLDKLGQAAPLVRTLATDQSLRGLSHALSLGLQGIRAGRLNLDTMAPTLDTVADTLDGVLADRPGTSFSWQVLVKGAPASPQDLTGLIYIWPVLNYSAIEPGRAAAQAVRDAAAQAGLAATYGATLRLTGTVPLADLQFATIRQDASFNFIVTGVIILVVLWLALRSLRIVLGVVLSIAAGLVVTAAVGLLLVGAFNPISVAFAVLFVGLGADFAIQFSVRYRDRRHRTGGLERALAQAGRHVGAPLTLAALAAAAGFFSFVPTDYRGLAELGLIAGCGMVVAYLASMTLLPALLWVLGPPQEPRPLGYAALAPADRFLQRHRLWIVAATAIVALAGSPLLFRLQFNFDPNALQNPRAEAIATLHQLNNDPRAVFNGADVLTAQADAPATVQRLAALPQVASVRTLDSFVPADQDQKRQQIARAAASLDPALTAPRAGASSDADDVAALKAAAKDLQDNAAETGGPGAEAARRLATDLNGLADASAETRRRAAAVFVDPLRIDLAQLSASLHPQTVTRADLPPTLVQNWTAQDGEVRVEAVPKGNANDTATAQRFARAVLAVAPNATGPAIATYEWGRTVTAAFVKAGAVALGSIAILLLLVLRRIGDMLLTLIPLLVAAAATLEICGLTGFQLNYANIIALPALLGVGVAFKIYYVMAWRGGEYNFLESSLTRAVFFSALMTATAFGSLWFSSNPGISSMGKLLALSLACTLASAALFQPALMGPPRGRPGKPLPRD